MKVGVPKEIKTHEYRVGLTTDHVKLLVAKGHCVFVETEAGCGIGMTDAQYQAAGATICATPADVFEQADMIVKVKEPQATECQLLKPHHILFTFLHLAADAGLTDQLLASGATGIAYETVTIANGKLPCLAPMSEVAGRIAVQKGAHSLEKAQGGRGILLGGVPGIAPAKVVIIGGGSAGTQALTVARGMGAQVTVLDRSLDRLRALDAQFGQSIVTEYSNEATIEAAVTQADLVIGAVLIPGLHAPKVVSKQMLTNMHPGAVLVDIAIDQGGCFETSQPTNFDEPTFIEQGIVHQCITNLPGAVPLTSTLALTNATFPYVCDIADKGWKRACQEDAGLRNGVNTVNGCITHENVALSMNKPMQPVAEALQLA